ncbi:MAG: hypothetical protein EZS28_006572, partial [Streblomastix strix]
HFLEFIVRKNEEKKKNIGEIKEKEKEKDGKASSSSSQKNQSQRRLELVNRYILPSQKQNQVVLTALAILGLADKMHLKDQEKQFKESYILEKYELDIKESKQNGDIEFKFAPGSLNNVGVSGKKATYNTSNYKTVIFDPPIISSEYGPIVRCDITFDSCSSNYCGFGLIMSDFVIPDGNRAYNSNPWQAFMLMYHQDGNVYHCGNTWSGNSSYGSGHRLAIEVDMSKKPHVAYFFYNDNEQSQYVQGIPESVKFFVCVYI